MKFDIDSIINGEKYKCAKHWVTFIKALITKNLGIDAEILIGPLNDPLNDKLNKTIQDVKNGVKEFSLHFLENEKLGVDIIFFILIISSIIIYTLLKLLNLFR